MIDDKLNIQTTSPRIRSLQLSRNAKAWKFKRALLQNKEPCLSSYRVCSLMKLKPQKERQFKFWNMAMSHENRQLPLLFP